MTHLLNFTPHFYSPKIRRILLGHLYSQLDFSFVFKVSEKTTQSLIQINEHFNMKLHTALMVRWIGLKIWT